MYSQSEYRKTDCGIMDYYAEIGMMPQYEGGMETLGEYLPL